MEDCENPATAAGAFLTIFVKNVKNALAAAGLSQSPCRTE